MEADRGHLEDSLSVVKKEKRRLTDEFLRVKIELKRAHKKLQEYENGVVPTERTVLSASSNVHKSVGFVQVFTGDGPSDSYPQSPTASDSTVDSKISGTAFSLERRISDERPPRPPISSVSG